MGKFLDVAGLGLSEVALEWNPAETPRLFLERHQKHRPGEVERKPYVGLWSALARVELL